ncbi:hypothetical protein ZYGM_002323 [Zygosaccharomyces mellis]|uniref:Uncharacterized protein n=1 Tax=Zygosaccharomyces mellis TaxID=42258 RepID=A0A4C2E910_9SACH|nr:hypothetical protein ZYGM_002323 [Zygosaccharomyces mellis]
MYFSSIINVLAVLLFLSNMGIGTPLPIDFKKLTKDISNNTPQGPNRNTFVPNIKYKLPFMGISDPNPSRAQQELSQVLQKLAEVDKLILQITEKYHDQKQILYAFETLLKLKNNQMDTDKRSLCTTTKHLTQLIKALNIMISTHWNNRDTNLEIMAVGDLTPNVNVTTNSNSYPGLKRVLSTGGFVFLIFSTASDICVMTGGAFCVAVYLAGTGGIVIWLNSIYKTALNIN